MSSEKIPAGTYKGRGVAGSAQMGMTSTGTDQVAIDLEIPALGRVLTTFLFFSDGAKPYSIDRLLALGWDGSDDPSFVGIDANEVDVVVKYEDYKGEQKMKVEILTGGGGKVTLKDQMSETQKRGFMTALKTAAKQAGGVAPKASAPKAGGGFAL